MVVMGVLMRTSQDIIRTLLRRERVREGQCNCLQDVDCMGTVVFAEHSPSPKLKFVGFGLYCGNEKNLSAQKAQTSSRPRFYEAFENTHGPRALDTQASEGPGAPVNITRMSTKRLTRSGLAQLQRAGVRRLHGAYFSLVAAPLAESKVSKFTCAVSVKASRKAVERNLVKRRCREAVRGTLAKVKRPLGLAFYAKREAVQAQYVELARDIEKLVAQAAK